MNNGPDEIGSVVRFFAKVILGAGIILSLIGAGIYVFLIRSI